MTTATVKVADLWKEWGSGCDTSDQAGNVVWNDPVAAVLQAETTDEYPMFYAWKKKCGKSFCHYRHVLIREIVKQPDYRRTGDGKIIAQTLDTTRGSRSLQKFAKDIAAAAAAAAKNNTA